MAKQRTVSKADLVSKVAEQTGKSRRDVKQVVDTALSEIITSLESGGKVQLTGFGTFEVRKRKARSGVKPGTTEKIKIPASQYPAFKAGKSLKDTVSGKKSSKR